MECDSPAWFKIIFRLYLGEEARGHLLPLGELLPPRVLKVKCHSSYKEPLNFCLKMDKLIVKISKISLDSAPQTPSLTCAIGAWLHHRPLHLESLSLSPAPFFVCSPGISSATLVIFPFPSGPWRRVQVCNCPMLQQGLQCPGAEEPVKETLHTVCLSEYFVFSL